MHLTSHIFLCYPPDNKNAKGTSQPGSMDRNMVRGARRHATRERHHIASGRTSRNHAAQRPTATSLSCLTGTGTSRSMQLDMYHHSQPAALQDGADCTLLTRASPSRLPRCCTILAMRQRARHRHDLGHWRRQTSILRHGSERSAAQVQAPEGISGVRDEWLSSLEAGAVQLHARGEG